MMSRRHDAVIAMARQQKSNRGAAGYSRWINRPAGRQIAAVCHVLGLSPDGVSVISALFTFPGLVAIAWAKPTWISGSLIALALLVGYAFDSADGQLARLQRAGSLSGELLDHVLDALKIAGIHVAVAVCWYRFYAPRPALLLIPLLFVIVATSFFTGLLLADQLRRRTGLPVPTGSEPAPILRSLLVLPNDYGVLALTFVFLSQHGPYLVVYSILLGFNTVFLAVGFLRWFRELRALTAMH